RAAADAAARGSAGAARLNPAQPERAMSKLARTRGLSPELSGWGDSSNGRGAMQAPAVGVLAADVLPQPAARGGGGGALRASIPASSSLLQPGVRSWGHGRVAGSSATAPTNESIAGNLTAASKLVIAQCQHTRSSISAPVAHTGLQLTSACMVPQPGRSDGRTPSMEDGFVAHSSRAVQVHWQRPWQERRATDCHSLSPHRVQQAGGVAQQVQ
ncbi:hypothetical protein QJQ45_025809, partial [Haematococcus lacustris]